MNSLKRVCAFPIKLEFGSVGLRRGENRSTRRKTSQSKGENQQQTQPTYHIMSSNYCLMHAACQWMRLKSFF